MYAKIWNKLATNKDHYRNEGLRQNALVKQLLEETNMLKAQLAEAAERKYMAADEARLNNQELYEVAIKNVHEMVKYQGA